MAKKIIKFFKRFFSHRLSVLLIVFLLMSSFLLVRLFQLQIVQGEEYSENFTIMTTRERRLKSTRGNIYDRNGNLIAYNELSNSVTFEDSGRYSSTRERNLSLNSEIYRLINLIESCGDTITSDFHIIVDDSGNFAFDLEEGTTSLNRFRADVYGQSSIDDLTAEQSSATAEQIMEYLSGADNYALYNEENPYTEEELAEYGLPAEFTREEQLKIVTVRYLLWQTSFQRYVQVTIATDVSDSTVAAIYENQDSLPGVAIAEDSIRVYNYSESMASIIGYTGSASQEELEELSEERNDYDSTSVIGKAGIEQYMETTLKGTDGSEEVTVDSVGRVQSINEESRVEPVQGNDVYLTIDSDLQEACYQILEQRIAGILVSNIQPIKSLEAAGIDPSETDAIPIPIYDVYYALIENSVINLDHFTEAGASAMEQWVYQAFVQKQEEVQSAVSAQLSADTSVPYSQLSSEMQEYVDYIVDDMLTEAGILNSETIDTSDSVYQQWNSEHSISLQAFLSYAASQNWVDVTRLSQENSYLDSTEVYQALTEYILQEMAEDSWFYRIYYKYMLQDDILSGEDICQLLYDQGVLSTEDNAYASFQAGTLSAYDLMIQKISSLEITPAQLALDPCSGSIVVVDPDTGEVLALVSYPGYDNNRLANQMDTDYYYQLYYDLSTPFYNKATQQLTAPGSTFKPVTIAAGLNEGVIDNSTIINCNGLFGEGLVDTADQLHCWYLAGHGDLDVIGAITNSCNVFLCTTAYFLGQENGEFSQSLALEKIQEYAELFGLGRETGIQITESSPQISTAMPLPSAIGQGTHAYTTSQLARYASTIYNNGTIYQLNLLDKVTDSDGNVQQEYSPVIEDQMQLDDWIWEDIHEGMREMIQGSGVLSSLNLELYGKSGTAQESDVRPDHGLFIGHAHSGNKEDIAFAARIAYGYSSTNAATVVRDVLNYYYELEDASEILTGGSTQSGLSNDHND